MSRGPGDPALAGPAFLPCPFPQEEPEGAEPLNNSALKLLCGQEGSFIYFLTLQPLQFHSRKHLNPKPGPGFRARTEVKEPLNF